MAGRNIPLFWLSALAVAYIAGHAITASIAQPALASYQREDAIALSIYVWIYSDQLVLYELQSIGRMDTRTSRLVGKPSLPCVARTDSAQQ